LHHSANTTLQHKAKNRLATQSQKLSQGNSHGGFIEAFQQQDLVLASNISQQPKSFWHSNIPNIAHCRAAIQQTMPNKSFRHANWCDM
jgi:uncharacterized protein YecE (DUF72 family)